MSPVRTSRSFVIVLLAAAVVVSGGNWWMQSRDRELRRRATQAYVTACDKVLAKAIRDAASRSVAAQNDELIAACDSVLAVGSSVKADPSIVGQYREATRALRAWCIAKPDWRSVVASIGRGSLAGVLDSFGGGGLALGVVVAWEKQNAKDTQASHDALVRTLTQWRGRLAEAGITSEFWRQAQQF